MLQLEIRLGEKQTYIELHQIRYTVNYKTKGKKQIFKMW